MRKKKKKRRGEGERERERKGNREANEHEFGYLRGVGGTRVVPLPPSPIDTAIANAGEQQRGVAVRDG